MLDGSFLVSSGLVLVIVGSLICAITGECSFIAVGIGVFLIGIATIPSDRSDC